MSTRIRKLLPITVGFAAFSWALGAAAHDRDDHYRGWDRGNYGWERSEGRGWGHGHQWREERWERRVFAPPVYYRPAPPVVYQPRVYYERPYYVAPRSPAVVIGVDVPPIVIPLR